VRAWCRHYQEPNGAKEDPADVNKLQKPIQGRVLNVLQKWVENSFYDFAEDDVLLERLVRFVADNIPTNMFAHKLIKGVRKKVYRTLLRLRLRLLGAWRLASWRRPRIVGIPSP
jgi:hypothetical protein